MQVNVVIECYDTLKSKFPFAKPHQQVPMYGATNNAWNALYQNPTQNQNQGANYGGGGFNPNTWGNNNNNTNSNNTTWGSGNTAWGGQGNQGWGGQGGMGGGMGGIIGGIATSGMGGGMGGGVYGANQTTSNIAKAQAFVGKTKKNL